MSETLKNVLTVVGGLALGLIGLVLVFVVVGVPGGDDQPASDYSALSALPSDAQTIIENMLEEMAALDDGHTILVSSVGTPQPNVYCVNFAIDGEPTLWAFEGSGADVNNWRMFGNPGMLRDAGC